MPQPFLLYRKRNFLYSKNAPQGCDPCGVEYALACPHGRAKSHKVTLCFYIGKGISYIVKMLRRDATRVELNMHLRAHTGAQRVTK